MVMATLIYQRAMSVSDWTGASVIALIMIVVTLAVIRGFNALAAKLDRRGENLSLIHISRTLFSPVELSISTVTAVFGAPVVIYMMIQTRGRR